MYRINESCVFVKGAKNGAIYDFITGKVYSVNAAACDILNRYISGKRYESDNDYLSKLEACDLISNRFLPTTYKEEPDKSINMEVAWIEITNACNLRCVHCYEGTVHNNNTRSISLEMWKDVVDQLETLCTKRLIIIGGEPCCNPDVGEIILHSSQKNMDVTLFTNATLIDKRLLEIIVNSRIKVKISVYGPRADIHDGVTGLQGSFDRMLSAVTKMTNTGVSVSAAVIIMKENEDYAEETMRFCRSIGMKCSRYDVIREVCGGLQNEHVPSNKELLRNVYYTKPNFRADRIQFRNNNNRNSCWYGKIAIKENGDVIPCEFERNYIYGNIMYESLDSIIKSEKAQKMWFWDFSKIEGCAECEYRFACKDCRPLGKSVCGSYETKNPRCLYDPITGKWSDLE